MDKDQKVIASNHQKKKKKSPKTVAFFLQVELYVRFLDKYGNTHQPLGRNSYNGSCSKH
jgi:hypothetical protein